jgi:hypothetical protein
MAEPLRHRQTKEAATDMFYLKPPRHISTLPKLLNTTTETPAVSAQPDGEFVGAVECGLNEAFSL